MPISTNKLATKLNLKQEEIFKKLIELKIIKDKTTLTPKGIKLEGEIKKYMGSKYINWKNEEKITMAIESTSESVLSTIIKKITKPKEIEVEEIKKEPKVQKRISSQEKIIKGTIYEEFIALIYKANGYTIWEHGKDKGVLDGGIDLIVKKERIIILIQCKNWNEKGKFTIDHKDIKAFRSEGRDFLEKNEIFKGYDLHLKYILSGNFIHKSAIYHIEKCNENVSYEIIPIPKA